MNERRRMGSSREHRKKIKETLDGIEEDATQASLETNTDPLSGEADSTMSIREIDGRGTETWLRGYDANGIAELEEDPELMISEAEGLRVDSEKLIETVLSELEKRLKTFKDELAEMSEEELKRRYIDSINGEGPVADFAFVFPGVRIDEYDKLIRDMAEDIGKAQEWWDAA